MHASLRPTRAELDAARDKTIPDIIGPNLGVLFVGVNPGLYSAFVGHQFGRLGNRFWPTLARSGFTPRQLSPTEDRSLLDYGLGITNLVARATARADELSREELAAGASILVQKVRRFAPKVVAVLGVSAYRHALGRPKAQLGAQPTPLGGVPLWVLPNPSGLNAHHQLPDLARLYGQLRETL